jgi:hypothetical protein
VTTEVQTVRNINPMLDALLVPGTALPVAAPSTPQYKAARTTIITWIELDNTDVSGRTVTMHAIPPGGAAGVSTRIFAQALTAGQRLGIQSGEVILAGYTLQLTADSGAVVRASVSGQVQTP